MGLLDSLLGGGKKQEAQDFVQRYETGRPWEGISDDEALTRYQQVDEALPPEEYERSAEEAFSRLSPQERLEFTRFLRQRSQQKGVNFPDLNQDGIDDRLQQDPHALAQMTSRMRQQQPGLLGQLLGGAGGSPLGRAALAGVAAVALKKMMGGRR